MLAPDQRDHLAETLLEAIDQQLAMAVFLRRHLVEHRRRRRILRPQLFGIGRVDARIVLFRRDGERPAPRPRTVREIAAARRSPETWSKLNLE